MGNRIFFDYNISPDDDSLKMSNGGTNVFINVISLSGSELAETDSEKRLIVYLSEKDQMILGYGTVDFDIVDMPWNKDTFIEDKNFMLRVIQGARDKIGWEKLEYRPNEEFVLFYLEGFEKLINRMTVNDIRENSLKEWLNESKADDPVHNGFPRCKKHGTFLTYLGCQICHS